MRRTAASTGAALAVALAGAAAAGELRIEVTGARSPAGSIVLGLYDTAAGFAAAIDRAMTVGVPGADPDRVAGAAVRADSGIAAVSLGGLRPGRYAVLAFHDENGNGRVDTNLLGVPREGYGFANDAAGLLGPPSFGAASIAYDGTDRTITVRLRY